MFSLKATEIARTAKQLNENFKDEAMKVAIETGQPLVVIQYMYQRFNTPLSSTYIEVNNQSETLLESRFEEDDLPWHAVTLAAEKGRIDLLNWIFTDLKPTLIEDEQIDDILTVAEYAMHECQFETIRWLVRKTDLDWNLVITLMHAVNNEVFLAMLKEFSKEFVNSDDYDYLLKQAEDREEKLKMKVTGHQFFLHEYTSLLQQFIIHLTKVQTTLSSYEIIDPTAAFNFYLAHLQRNNQIKLAWHYCIEKLTYPILSDLSKLNMAEMLLCDRLELDESDSPLEFLNLNEQQIKRALQALYILRGCSHTQAVVIQQNMHAILSGQSKFSDIKSYSEKTWNNRYALIYSLYVFYKQNNEEAMTKHLIEKTRHYVNAVVQMQGLAEEKPPSNTLFNYFRFDPSN